VRHIKALDSISTDASITDEEVACKSLLVPKNKEGYCQAYY